MLHVVRGKASFCLEFLRFFDSMFNSIQLFNSIRYSLQYWNTQLCFNVVERCKFQRWRTQRYFNVDVTLCGGPTSYQPENNVETVLKCLLGINLNLLPKCVEDLFYKLKFISLWQIHHSFITCKKVQLIFCYLYSTWKLHLFNFCFLCHFPDLKLS